MIFFYDLNNPLHTKAQRKNIFLKMKMKIGLKYVKICHIPVFLTCMHPFVLSSYMLPI